MNDRALYATLVTESCEALLGPTSQQLLHPRNFALEKLSTERLRGEGSRCPPPRAHVGIPARQRDSWPMQRNFDSARRGNWLLTLSLWQEGAHYDRDTKMEAERWL